MSNTIKTTGDGTTLVDTQYQSGDTSAQWARDWAGELDNANVSGVSQLKTCWPNPSGECCEETNRLPGETDAEFRSRHKAEVAVKMLECPPIPEEPPS